jgi:hypothetical protein
MLVDVAAAGLDSAGEAGEIHPRMEARLIVEANARSTHQRYVGDERRVESHFARERRLVLEIDRCLLPRSIARCVHVGRHAREVADDRFAADDFVDLCDGGQPRIPCGLRMFASE